MSHHRLKNLISSQSAVGFFPFSFKGRPPAGKSLIGLFRKATRWKVTINREQCCGTFFVLCDWIWSHPLAQRKPRLTIEAFVTFQLFVPKRCISIQARGAWRLKRGRPREEGSAGSQTPLQTPWAAVCSHKSERTDRDLVWRRTSSPTGSASSCNPFSPESVSSFVKTFGWVPFSCREQMCQFGVASYCFLHGKQGITEEM